MHLNPIELKKLENGSVELFIGENRYCGELSALEADEQTVVLKFEWVAKALRAVWTKTPLFNLSIDLTRTFIGVYGEGLEFSCPSRRAIVRIYPRGAATHVRKEDIVESLYSIARESLPEKVDTFLASVQVPGMAVEPAAAGGSTLLRR